MRRHFKAAALAATLGTILTCSAAQADPSGAITVWAWNTAAAGLRDVVPGFNKKFPNVKVTVEDVGGPQVYQKILASCAAGGTDLPDVVGLQNSQGETVWSRFPDCFTGPRCGRAYCGSVQNSS